MEAAYFNNKTSAIIGHNGKWKQDTSSIKINVVLTIIKIVLYRKKRCFSHNGNSLLSTLKEG